MTRGTYPHYSRQYRTAVHHVLSAPSRSQSVASTLITLQTSSPLISSSTATTSSRSPTFLQTSFHLHTQLLLRCPWNARVRWQQCPFLRLRRLHSIGTPLSNIEHAAFPSCRLSSSCASHRLFGPSNNIYQYRLPSAIVLPTTSHAILQPNTLSRDFRRTYTASNPQPFPTSRSRPVWSRARRRPRSRCHRSGNGSADRAMAKRLRW